MAREKGARKVHFAPLKANTYETPISLKWCTSLETENEYTDVQFNGDCTIEYEGKNLDKINITLGISSALPNETLAKICGYDYADGVMSISPESISLNGALLFEVLMSDGTTKRNCIYNASLYKNASSYETDSTGEDAIYEFEGAGIPVEIGGKQYIMIEMSQSDIDAMADEDKKTTAQAKYDSWFETVVLPA